MTISQEMQNKLVIVVENLKPSALRGEMSNGMIMCASEGVDDARKVVFVNLPEGSVPGDRIVAIDAEKYPATPAAEVVNPKGKVNAWTTCAPQFNTNANGEFCFGDIVLGVNGKAATSTLANARVA